MGYPRGPWDMAPPGGLAASPVPRQPVSRVDVRGAATVAAARGGTKVLGSAALPLRREFAADLRRPMRAWPLAGDLGDWADTVSARSQVSLAFLLFDEQGSAVGGLATSCSPSGSRSWAAPPPCRVTGAARSVPSGAGQWPKRKNKKYPLKI